MPARKNLEGAVFGRLTVVRRAEMTGTPAWLVRCECGAEEIYPQRRLTEARQAIIVRSCSACDAPTCQVCGAKIDAGRSNRRNCDHCNPILKREQQRQYQARKAVDPIARATRLARVAARRKADPEKTRKQEAARWAKVKALDAVDPARVERRLARARERHAQMAAERWAARRQRLESMGDEEFAEWRERARQYARNYANRRRTVIAADPERHQEYLDIMTEYRRRRALARLMASAAEITSKVSKNDK